MFQNAQELVDAVVVRYGVDNAASRAKVLGWLNRAMGVVWGAGDFAFKWENVDVAMAVGEHEYTVERCEKIRRDGIRVKGGTPLIEFTPAQFDHNFGAHVATVGTPEVYSVRPRAEGEAVDFLRFHVYPACDNAAGFFTVAKQRPVPELADSTDSVPVLPSAWWEALLAGAEELASVQNQQLATVQFEAQKVLAVVGRLAGSGV